MSHEDGQPGENRVNVEYYRKLNQQLVQKDNIIKLLQLKLKNLESRGPNDDRPAIAAGGPLPVSTRAPAGDMLEIEARPPIESARLAVESQTQKNLIDELKSQIADLKREIEERDERLSRTESDRSRDRTGPRVKELQAELTRVTSRLRDQESESARFRAELDERRGTPGVGADDPLLQEELDALRLELNEAREENLVLRGRIERLEADTTAGPAASPGDPAGGGGTLDRSVLVPLTSLLAEVGSLRHQLSEDQRAHWIDIETRLDEIASRLDLERIRCVGEVFDPDRHQAVGHTTLPDHPHDLIIREVAPGFIFGTDWIRLADVVVNRNPSYCPTCEEIGASGSKFCNQCGGRLLGGDPGGVRSHGPDLARSHFDLGLSFEESGDLATARIHYEKALDLDPRLARVLEGLARILEKEGRYDEALSLVDRLALDSHDALKARQQRQRIQLKKEIADKLVQL